MRKIAGGISGAGLGLRYSFVGDAVSDPDKPLWFEIAPENWMGRGGFFRRSLERIRSEREIVCHGLSLSIGSPDPLNIEFLKDLKEFLDYFEISLYSEHISLCSLNGSYIYDLLPLPMTEGMVKHISTRVHRVQEILERPLILENISYYGVPFSTMKEPEFINSILSESGAYLLLDVNNVYVNSLNHNYDPYSFIDELDLSKVAYIHIAGHERFERVIIDTHGAPVKKEVLRLLDYTIAKVGDVPVLLERDNNIPPYRELKEELRIIEGMIHGTRV